MERKGIVINNIVLFFIESWRETKQVVVFIMENKSDYWNIRNMRFWIDYIFKTATNSKNLCNS